MLVTGDGQIVQKLFMGRRFVQVNYIVKFFLIAQKFKFIAWQAVGIVFKALPKNHVVPDSIYKLFIIHKYWNDKLKKFLAKHLFKYLNGHVILLNVANA